MKRFLFLILLFPSLVFSQTGTFSVALTTTDSMVYDTPGAFMSVHGTIYNLSATDSVELSIEKQFVDIPATWETALCTDICYPASVSYVTLAIPPADSQEFVFYFYTDLVADSGYARVLYTNLNVSGNTVLHGYHGITTDFVGVGELNENGFSVYPNPATEAITIERKELFSNESYVVTDISGRIVLQGNLREGQSRISVALLATGNYVLRLGNEHFRFVKK